MLIFGSHFPSPVDGAVLLQRVLRSCLGRFFPELWTSLQVIMSLHEQEVATVRNTA